MMGCTFHSINYFIIWLNPQVDKMKQILHSDRLAESTQDGPILPRQDFQHLYKSIIDQVRSAKMAGYCRRSFLRVNFRNLCSFGEMHFL